MRLGLSPKERRAALLLLPAVMVFLYLGWRLFWFLTDDAFISFRYAANLASGHGLVWNPEPFRPVEGYSNFLWVVLLARLWSWTGLQPPVTANAVALFFSFLSLMLFSFLLLTMRWREGLAPYRLGFLAITLLGLLGNRTFLAWTSSGLETAMYNCFILLWLACLLRLSPERGSWFLFSSLSATLLALTRPDGMLFLLGTLALGLVMARRSPPGRRWMQVLKLAVPASLAGCHLLWRRLFYGEWLPNTYRAKIGSPWPESGWRYLLSFVLEYAIWFFLAAAAVVLLRARRRKTGPAPAKTATRGLLPAAAGLLALQFLYYTWIAGGDHFEYRIYSHLLFLLFLGWIWILNRSALRPGPAAALLLLSIACSWPVPWTHWWLSRGLTTREQTHMMRVPVAEAWPGPFRWYARPFDRLQAWMAVRYVCTRHQEHKVALLWMQGLLPGRDQGERISAPGFPVMTISGGAGFMGWVLPRIAIIDLFGLNDYVIARTPPPADGSIRRMAHSRRPLPAYIAGFAPNVRLLPGRRIEITPRPRELTAERIRQFEEAWWKWARNR